jgi:hypothetical protein
MSTITAGSRDASRAAAIIMATMADAGNIPIPRKRCSSPTSGASPSSSTSHAIRPGVSAISSRRPSKGRSAIR